AAPVSAGALEAPTVTAASVAPAVKASAAALLPQRLDLMLIAGPSKDIDRLSALGCYDRPSISQGPAKLSRRRDDPATRSGDRTERDRGEHHDRHAVFARRRQQTAVHDQESAADRGQAEREVRDHVHGGQQSGA